MVYIIGAKKLMSSPITRVSATEMISFHRCRLAWHYGSANRMNIRPKKPATALLFGTGIHEALAQYYSDNVNPATVFRIWWTQELANLQEQYPEDLTDLSYLEEMLGLGVGMLDHYKEWAKSQDNFRVLHTEIEFEVPIIDPMTGEDTGGILVGRFDGIAKDSIGDIWLLEHKTYYTEPAQNALLIDAQTGKYQWAAQQLIRQGAIAGIPKDAILRGAVYNGLRKKLPRKPTLLSSGKGFSKATNIDTTYEVYLQTILENNFDPNDYIDILTVLRARGNKFFKREYVRRTQEELKIIGNRLAMEYKEMARPDLPIYPSPTRECPAQCQYFDLCLLEQTGGDNSFLIKYFYEPRERKGKVYPYPEAVTEQVIEEEISTPF